jgi:hypothetical protein
MWRSFTLLVLLVSVLALSPRWLSAAGGPAPDVSDQSAIQEAAHWVEHVGKIEAEYRYVMTCRVRLLLFWAGKDDVGGGYVRMGEAADQDRQQIIQILFGSDPKKAPLAINRWGAGTEVLRTDGSGQPAASAFFGFMKSSKGQSVMAMQHELTKEKAGGDHRFEAIVSRVDAGRALSSTVPYTSSQDFDFNQYTEASEATLQELASNPSRHIRRLDGAARQTCPRVGEFLTTTRQLMDDALAGRSTPISYCYVYNARHYKATLVSVQRVAEKNIHLILRGNPAPFDRTYRDLQEARFVVEGEDPGAKSTFSIVMGTQGSLRGAPIQIMYQPNWWFQVILNLAPESPQLSTTTTAHAATASR